MYKQNKILFRCSLMSLVALSFFSLLTSCSSPVTRGDGRDSGQGTLFEDMGNGVCRQLRSGLMWQVDPSKKFATSKEAVEYVNNLQLAGFDDWRLPNREEVLDLAELMVIQKNACAIAINKALWVIDNNGKRQSGHWEDYPMCAGSEFRWVKDKKGIVRAVRP